MPFDIKAAKDAGYSDDEIRTFLLSQPGTDEAKGAGYSENDILNHYGFAPQVETLPTPSASAPSTMPADPSDPNWSTYEAGATGATLGAYPRVKAAIQASSKISPLEVGPSSSQGFWGDLLAATLTPHTAEALGYKRLKPSDTPSAWGQEYSKDLGDVQNARSAYNTQHPYLGTGVELASSILPTLAANALTPEIAAPSAFGRVGAFGARVVNRAIQGAEAGALQTPLTGGDVSGNTALGAGIGAAFPVVGAAGRQLLSPAIDPLVAAAARRAQILGINLRPGQLATSKGWQRIDSKLTHDPKQLEDYTQAVGRTFGADARALTPQVMEDAQQTLQQKMNSFAGRANIAYDPTLHGDINTVLGDLSGLPRAAQKQVHEVAGTIRSSVDNGNLTGKMYQRLTNRGGAISNLSNDTDPTVRNAGRSLRDALDNALERSNPADLADIKATRAQFRNFFFIEPLAKDAQPTGVLDPQRVHAAVHNWADPNSDMGTLGTIGRFLPKPTAQGGVKTSNHLLPAWAKWLGASGEMALALHDPKLAIEAAGVAAAGAGATKATAAILRSTPYRNLALGQASRVNSLVPGVVGVGNEFDGQRGGGGGQ